MRKDRCIKENVYFEIKNPLLILPISQHLVNKSPYLEIVVCASPCRAEPSRAEPSRAEPSRAEPRRLCSSRIKEPNAAQRSASVWMSESELKYQSGAVKLEHRMPCIIHIYMYKSTDEQYQNSWNSLSLRRSVYIRLFTAYCYILHKYFIY